MDVASSRRGRTHGRSEEVDLPHLHTDTGCNTPKPSRRIRRFLENYSEGEDIILDSFAGREATAQAVLTLNKEDRGPRQFIFCQVPYEGAGAEEREHL